MSNKEGKKKKIVVQRGWFEGLIRRAYMVQESFTKSGLNANTDEEIKALANFSALMGYIQSAKYIIGEDDH